MALSVCSIGRLPKGRGSCGVLNKLHAPYVIKHLRADILSLILFSIFYYKVNCFKLMS